MSDTNSPYGLNSEQNTPNEQGVPLSKPQDATGEPISTPAPPPFEGNPYTAPQAAQPVPTVMYQIPPMTAKSVTVAYLLYFLFGGLGIHKFYLRQNVQGLMYIGAIVGGVIFSFIFPPLGFIISLAIYAFLFADVVTMSEQVDRSNRGEIFGNIFEFVQKVFTFNTTPQPNPYYQHAAQGTYPAPPMPQNPPQV